MRFLNLRRGATEADNCKSGKHTQEAPAGGKNKRPKGEARGKDKRRKQGTQASGRRKRHKQETQAKGRSKKDKQEAQGRGTRKRHQQEARARGASKKHTQEAEARGTSKRQRMVPQGSQKHPKMIPKIDPKSTPNRPGSAQESAKSGLEWIPRGILETVANRCPFWGVPFFPMPHWAPF